MSGARPGDSSAPPLPASQGGGRELIVRGAAELTPLPVALPPNSATETEGGPNPRRLAFLAAGLVVLAAIATAVFLFTRPGETTVEAEGPAATIADPAAAVEAAPPAMPPLVAAEPDLAYGAYQRGLYVSAFEKALALAEQGNPRSQMLLGMLYSEGLGVPQDLVEAAGWFELAARGGDAAAQLAAGLAYLNGAGVERNRVEADRYFEMAAAQNQRDALYNLGLLTLEGAVVPRDLARVVEVFSRAAELGLPEAQLALARLYMVGEWVMLSDEIANAWLLRAAEGGLVDAQIEYAIRIANGIGGPADEAAAARWLRLAAVSGNPVGQARYGRLLAVGVGVPADPVEAGKWYLVARAAGLDDEWLRIFFAGLTDTQRSAALEAAARLAWF